MKPLDVVCMGEILVDFMGHPAARDLAECDRFTPSPGGAPANVAVGLARLGVASAFIGKVGDDAFGRMLRNVLEENGARTDGLAVSYEQPTTLAFVALDAAGTPSFAFYRHPGADQTIAPHEIDEKLFTHARAFHFGSLSLTGEPARESTMRCLEIARKAGMTVSYDPNFRPALWPDEDTARRAMLAPLPQTDILKVSEEEMRLLSGHSDTERACRALAERGPSLIAVTLGAEGMVGLASGTFFRVPGEVVDVVDTTGCGDSSVAGYLTHLVEHGLVGRDGESPGAEAWEAALRFANRCAASTAQSLGGIPALPRREDLDL